MEKNTWLEAKNDRAPLSAEVFFHLYMGAFPVHDHKACDALRAYEINCQKYEGRTRHGLPAPIPAGERMSDFAKKYDTTEKAMKEHWRCLESDGTIQKLPR